MKALSIKQPWAWCIVTGRKPVENRNWPTRYRGQFLVHAGKSFDRAGFDWLKSEGLIPSEMKPADFQRGGIVGGATIIDCVEEMCSSWFFGPYGFQLTDAHELPFIPVRGQLGFFSVMISWPRQCGKSTYRKCLGARKNEEGCN